MSGRLLFQIRIPAAHMDNDGGVYGQGDQKSGDLIGHRGGPGLMEQPEGPGTERSKEKNRCPQPGVIPAGNGGIDHVNNGVYEDQIDGNEREPGMDFPGQIEGERSRPRLRAH